MKIHLAVALTGFCLLASASASPPHPPDAEERKEGKENKGLVLLSFGDENVPLNNYQNLLEGDFYSGSELTPLQGLQSYYGFGGSNTYNAIGNEFPVSLTKQLAIPNKIATYPTIPVISAPVQPISITIAKNLKAPVSHSQMTMEVPVALFSPNLSQKPVKEPTQESMENPIPLTVPVPVEKPMSIPLPVQKTILVPVSIEKPMSMPIIVQNTMPIPITMEKPVPVPITMMKPHPIPITMEKTVPVPSTTEKPIPVLITMEKPVLMPMPQALQVPMTVVKHMMVPNSMMSPMSIPVSLLTPTIVPVEMSDLLNTSANGQHSLNYLHQKISRIGSYGFSKFLSDVSAMSPLHYVITSDGHNAFT